MRELCLELKDSGFEPVEFELGFGSGEDLPPIKSFDTSGNVVLGNSFFKIFSAGSRLGYMVALMAVASDFSTSP